MLSAAERRFIENRRIAHLATADAKAVPQVLPVGFALSADGATVYSAVDEKPKGDPPVRLKRLRNIDANPAVSMVFDHYEEDWRRIGWLMLRGRAEILQAAGPEPASATALLHARYPQYAGMRLGPIIALRIGAVRRWGNLGGP
jgi:PPOX class probable F420-dependent enzyme